MRKKIPINIETDLLLNSKRRCCLCSGLNGDFGQKDGQIAHLDKDSQNNKLDNLAWLCLFHHSNYDSITSQHKNYTLNEVKAYRSELYNFLDRNRRIDDVNFTQEKPESTHCIYFDGFSNYMYIENKDFYTLLNYDIDLHIKFQNNVSTGLFSSLSFLDNSILFIKYNSSKSKAKSGEIHVIYIQNGSIINEVFRVPYLNLDWTVIKIRIVNSNLSFHINDQIFSRPSIISEPRFNKILFGGGLYELNKFPSLYPCYLSNVTVFDNSTRLLINDLDFSYGQDYLLKKSKWNGMRLVNAPRFIENTNQKQTLSTK